MPTSPATNPGTALLEWMAAQPAWSSLILAVLLLLIAWLAQLITERYLVRLIGRIVSRTRLDWDALQRRRVLNRLSWAVPLLVVRIGLPWLPVVPAGVGDFVQRVLGAAMAIVLVQALVAFINVIGDVYEKVPDRSRRPIKGYLQGIILVLYLFAAVVVIATLAERDPLLILSGLGAASAIILLIFRDTILSLVAGIQLTSNDLIRVGDWIEMPQFNADGDVIEIALNYVRVQNWDRTYTVIPAHKFLENSFKNWRGMQEAGGRRIKRSIVIDMTTVRFLTPEETERFRRFELLTGYIDRKERELAVWNAEHPASLDDAVNARRLTNFGTFRAYVTSYLRSHPGIHQNLTFLVRQLAPTAEGMPLEIYVFTSDTRWAMHEGVQADVFDHLLAILPEFGLAVFQNPSGRDMSALATRSGDA